MALRITSKLLPVIVITNIGIRNTPEGGRSSPLILRRIQELDKKGRLVALPPAVSDKTG